MNRVFEAMIRVLLNDTAWESAVQYVIVVVAIALPLVGVGYAILASGAGMQPAPAHLLGMSPP